MRTSPPLRLTRAALAGWTGAAWGTALFATFGWIVPPGPETAAQWGALAGVCGTLAAAHAGVVALALALADRTGRAPAGRRADLAVAMALGALYGTLALSLAKFVATHAHLRLQDLWFVASSALLVAGEMRHRALLLYDGTCALCDGTVRFLLRIDRLGRIDFAPLDGSTAAALRARHPWLGEIDSVALVLEPGSAAESVAIRSEAILGALAIVGGIWKIAALVRFLPRALRDWVYDRIAARRKRWFGELASCPLPALEHRRRFLP